MTVLLASTLALAWLSVSVVFIALCVLAARADRPLRSAAPLPRELRLVQRELLGRR